VSETIDVEAEVIKTPPAPAEQKLVKVDDKGIFTFTNQIELADAATMMIRTQLAPKHLRDEGKEAVAAALILCKQFNLPQKSMGQMAFIKGKITCFGSLVTALAERHPRYGDKKEFCVAADGKKISSDNENLSAPVWAYVVQIRKKDSDVWNEYFFSVDDAKAAGLSSDTWNKYKRDMLGHKARSRAFRAEYASALEGIDYHEDVLEAFTMKDVTPKSDRVKAIEDLAQEQGSTDETDTRATE